MEGRIGISQKKLIINQLLQLFGVFYMIIGIFVSCDLKRFMKPEKSNDTYRLLLKQILEIETLWPRNKLKSIHWYRFLFLFRYQAILQN